MYKVMVLLVCIFQTAAYLSRNVSYKICRHDVRKRPAGGKLHRNMTHLAQIKRSNVELWD